MKAENLPLIDISNYFNKSEVRKALELPANGTSQRLVEDYIRLHCLDTSHFDKRIRSNEKYITITKECPVCGKVFLAKKDHKKEKQTCSYSCSNTYFRSKENNPNWKDGASSYRSKMDISSCQRCGYNEHPEILQVHHIDRNRRNPDVHNLIVLCPNCHCLEHYEHKDGMYSFRKG